MKVKFVDLTRQNKIIEKEILNVWNKQITNCDFILGKEVELFEKEFASFCGTKYAVGVNSGTDALFLSLKAIGIKEGDSVIVPVNTFIATAFAVVYTGAKPIFVDCSEEDFNLDLSQVEDVLKKYKNKFNIKAIMPVHLYGQCCNMDEVVNLAKKYELLIVEDACQAHGAKFKNKPAGSFGECAAFSFYPSKNLGCFGDGGIVVTNNESIYNKICMLRNYGQKEKYIHLELGYNSRLDNLQAGILRVKLKYLEQWNQQRIELANYYIEKLSSYKNIVLPKVKNDKKHIWHLFVIRTKQRDELRKYLAENGVETGIHYPVPLHLTPYFKWLGYKHGDFPIAEKFSNEILSLPIFPGMTKDEIGYVIEVIQKFPWKN
jgi:dTDP-4-amino-4,6-dideoxygalactose transaminase